MTSQGLGTTKARGAAAISLTAAALIGCGGSGSGGVMTGMGGNPCPLPDVPALDPGQTDAVAGTVIPLDDNGAWTWYSDERAVVDVAGNKLIVGSDASGSGVGGTARDGQIDAVIYDLAAGTKERTTLGTLSPDDHNGPAFVVRPDGHYLAMYAGHNQDCTTYFRNYDGTRWAPQATFDWAPLGCDLSASTKVTYSNPWTMTAEGKVYSFVRSIGTSPNVLVSSDDGETWSYGGRLTSTPQVGYVAGYYKYWGNGVDRIDFVGTEAHPRDFDNSLYHGYVKGGKTYDSKDTMIDADLADGTSPQITAFTKLFATGSTIHGVRLTHAWNIDLARYDDGSIALLWKARADNNADSPDHRILYARWDGTSWKLTYLGKAGKKLYDSEQDYIGLGALHPNDPNTIYISTTIDPRDDTTDLGVHELFQGKTCDNGASWVWAPITQHSTRDNLRPIVPAWDASHTALLWFRGTYTTAQIFATEVVGVITP